MILALTLNDPHAALVAIRSKGIETRGWKYPPYAHGLRIAIHSSKGYRREDVEAFHRPSVYQALLAAGYDYFGALPRGCVVATAELAGCVPAEEVVVERARDLELEFGDYGPGRWGWLLKDVHRLETPVPCRGFQKLWRLPLDVEQAVVTQLKTAG